MARIVVNGVSWPLVILGLALITAGGLLLAADEPFGGRAARFAAVALLVVGMGCAGLAFESQGFAVLSRKGVRDSTGLIRWSDVTAATLRAVDGRHYLYVSMPAAKYPGRFPPRYDGYEPLEHTSWQVDLTESMQHSDLPRLLRSWLGDALTVEEQ